MEFHANLVGLKSKCHKVDITWRESMNYAAAVQDDNPYYLDDSREEGIVAPPMMAVALTWPLSERFEDFWGPFTTPEVLSRQVHYTEHIIWHRCMRPGDSLTIQGELVRVTPFRTSTNMVVCYTATDSAGNIVFEEYLGAMLRGVTCVGEGQTRELPSVPEVSDNDATVWEKPVEIGPLAAHVYDGCTGVVFPIHTSVKFARSVRLPGILYQGVATLSVAVKEVLNAEGAGNPYRLRAVNGCFTGMVFPNSTIQVRLLGRAPMERGVGLFFDVLANGRKAVSDGYVELRG